MKISDSAEPFRRVRTPTARCFRGRPRFRMPPTKIRVPPSSNADHPSDATEIERRPRDAAEFGFRPPTKIPDAVAARPSDATEFEGLPPRDADRAMHPSAHEDSGCRRAMPPGPNADRRCRPPTKIRMPPSSRGYRAMPPSSDADRRSRFLMPSPPDRAMPPRSGADRLPPTLSPVTDARYRPPLPVRRRRSWLSPVADCRFRLPLPVAIAACGPLRGLRGCRCPSSAAAIAGRRCCCRSPSPRAGKGQSTPHPAACLPHVRCHSDRKNPCLRTSRPNRG